MKSVLRYAALAILAFVAGLWMRGLFLESPAGQSQAPLEAVRDGDQILLEPSSQSGCAVVFSDQELTSGGEVHSSAKQRVVPCEPSFEIEHGLVKPCNPQSQCWPPLPPPDRRDLKFIHFCSWQGESPHMECNLLTLAEE